LKEFIKLVSEGVADFVILYGALMNEKIEYKYKEMAKKFREKDVFFAECNTAILKGLQNIYPELGYFVMYITREELGTSIDIDELKKRDKGFVLIPGIFTGKMSFDGLVEKFPEYIFNIETGEYGDDGLKGQTAYKGKVRGIVRVVKRKDQIDETQIGEVIVSPMTTPDFLPAMHKAVAFVTDEGGVTCHAAIIAREMQKPCIIGTKIATQVLKDGDLVEVDADNGVVRVLERVEDKSGQRIEFVKALERDTTFFMQGLFMQGLQGNNYLQFATDNPYRPIYIQYFNGENVQFWENRVALQWFSDKLLAENVKSPEFLEHVLENQKDVAHRIKKIWETEKLDNEEERQMYLDLVRRGITNVTIAFYTGMDERSPETAKEIAIKIRETIDLFAHGDEFIRKIFMERGYIPDLANLISPDEFISSPSIVELEARMSGVLLIDGTDLFVGSINDFLKSNPQVSFVGLNEVFEGKQKEVYGQVAFGGLVRGVVHLVRNRKQMERVCDGDILVSPMTTPDFLPAMHKAAAFVTDEGGVTCHAAIVAREMKKPCIIGTKIATQVLHDGDLVEVDADNGVVRVLERMRNNSPEDFDIDTFIDRGLLFYCTTRYSKLPIINIEAMFRCYVNNPYLSHLGIKAAPTSVVFMDESYEGWSADNPSKIVGDDKIVAISSMVKDAIERQDLELDELINLHKLSNENIINFIERANKLSTNIYHGFILFTDELFVTDDDRIIFDLQEVRMKLDALFIKLMKVFDRIVLFLVNDLGLEKEIIESAIVDEIIDMVKCLSDEKYVDIKGRPFACVIDGEKVYTLLNSDALSLKDKIHKQDPTKIKSVQAKNDGFFNGSIGNKGKTKGVVKVIHADEYNNRKNFENLMNVHDLVLVIPMTLPEMVPYFKHAKAIVTDEGGVTCHASIIAREMGVPCVIGTRVATQVLKDGDLVEVDADNGVVRMLERVQ
jgi:phosphohistidine swiveling domain-containing protein